VIGPARIAAYEILQTLSTGSGDLPGAVAAARERLHDERDRALAAEIAIGVERWRAALDHLIVEFSGRRLERLDAEVVDILRLSLYQLLHLTRVPAAAVVDDAVNLTRRAGKKSATGLVNAVLRAVSRGRRHLPLPARPGDPSDRVRALAYLSVTLSHPEWIAARWLDRVGFEAAEAWMRFNNTPAQLTLRTNRLQMSPAELTLRLSHAGVHVRRGAYAPDALIVEGGAPLRGPGLDQGWFTVQDEASQLAALLVNPAPGYRVLDTCASPGGKTTAFAAALDGRGLVVACDVRERRMQLLKKTVDVSGARNVRLVRADLLRGAPFGARFDQVVVDAPCSGLGTLRRDPDIRWRRRETDLPALAAAELTMLQNASDAVVPGGRLIYITCSSEPEENEGVADLFAATAPRFAPVDARMVSPRLAEAGVIDERGRLRTEPYRHGLEAFFGAVFEKRGL
jgi:16S rRNA (cytosine967-C5)-methyltransferase